MKSQRVALTAAILLAFAASAFAQGVPVGTILPVRLNPSLSKVKPGQTISGRIMQDVPLPDRAKIPEGAKVLGRVLSVVHGRNGANAQVTFEFDKVVYSKHTIAVTTNLRAMASFMEINDAQIPFTGPDRGTDEDSWTTRQVGGDIVYRGGGPVTEGHLSVGRPVYGSGVLAPVIAAPGTECPDEAGGNSAPQALWVFSADACGTYGFRDVTIVHTGRTDPLGQITLASSRGKLNVASGAGLLLRVIRSGQANGST